MYYYQWNKLDMYLVCKYISNPQVVLIARIPMILSIYIFLFLSFSHSLSLSLYIYIYCHPPKDCYIESQLLSVAGRFKQGSKPA